MFLTDFDEKKYRRILARDAKEEGREEGRREGRMEEREMINRLAKRMIQEGRLDDLERSFDDQNYQDQLLREYGIGYRDK